jgi:hypothetical protein
MDLNNNLLHMLESLLVISYLELYTVEYRVIIFTHFTFDLEEVYIFH